MNIEFHDIAERTDLGFSVIVAKDKKGNVFVRHKKRDTWEIPGGHIDKGETAVQAAERELIEETGALEYKIQPVCDYAVVRGEDKSFGRLFFAIINDYNEELLYEIEEVKSFSHLPENLTYPNIQPYLWNEVMKRMGFIQ